MVMLTLYAQLNISNGTVTALTASFSTRTDSNPLDNRYHDPALPERNLASIQINSYYSGKPAVLTRVRSAH